MRKAVICALATPFNSYGKIDVKSYVKLINYQTENGTDALLALGTTAESQLLTSAERKLLITIARSQTDLPVIAGIEEPFTRKAAKQAKLYAELGADALLIAPPSFCKCTATGYVEHVKAILRASNIPVVLYNIPSRSGYNLDLDAVTELSKTVRYVKDSCANTEFARKISSFCNVLCGSDEKLKEYLVCGAVGTISVVANVAPRLTRRACNGKDYATFQTLAQLAMSEINPIAIKYMLCKAGIFSDYAVRLPLTRASEKTKKAIDKFWDSHTALELCKFSR